MALRDLSEVLDPELLLPIKGKIYRVPPVDAETGLRLQRLAEHAAKLAHAVEAGDEPDTEALGDDNELDLYRDALGSAYGEMLADRVPFAWLKIAGITAWLHAAVGAERAEAYWNAAGNPEAFAGNREQRRAARSTRQPALQSGTNPKPAPPAGTTGQPSSRTGR
ncbi:hypothetical protein AB0L13_11410 [Saccharopolyspora shandongensis]|uniref:DUF7426 family protein n=1 Tax=Saccharopolyspora shandongensis TaxID=418495 RepID=UPI00342E10C9